MLHAQNRKFKREFGHGAAIRIAAIVSLIAASILVFAVAPGSASGGGRTERRNHRVRVPSAAAAANTAAMAMFPLPFAAIDVDRTDDTIVASVCSAAPNDCSLRGAVAFAHHHLCVACTGLHRLLHDICCEGLKIKCGVGLERYCIGHGSTLTNCRTAMHPGRTKCPESKITTGFRWL